MISPCPVCGYDWPAEARTQACPVCRLAPAEPSFARTESTWRGWRAGFAAIPRGLHFLLTTRGVKRWTIPPAVITFAAFIALTWWLTAWINEWLEAVSSGARAPQPLDANWFERALHWVLANSVLIVLAKLGGTFVGLVASFFAMLWTFSLVYELVSGPFLDEIQGKIERRWFGIDPREEREAPRDISPADCKRIALIAGAVSLVLVVAAFWLEGGWAWLTALGGPVIVFALAIARRPAFGRWLAWRAGTELRTLAVTIEASLISALMLVFALPLLLIPILGYPLFALAAGFTTAISLLDIPMSRRRWHLSLRMSFLLNHIPGVLAYGLVASLFFMVPIVGPLLMVPAASIGGLWLLNKLDKSCLSLRDPTR